MVQFWSAINNIIILLINTLYCANEHKFKYVILTKEKQNRKWAVNDTRGVYLFIFTAFYQILCIIMF